MLPRPFKIAQSGRTGWDIERTLFLEINWSLVSLAPLMTFTIFFLKACSSIQSVDANGFGVSFEMGTLHIPSL